MYLTVLFKADIRSKKINFILQKYLSIMSHWWQQLRACTQDNDEQEY